MERMTWKELRELADEHGWEICTDEDGQIVLYTGIYVCGKPEGEENAAD